MSKNLFIAYIALQYLALTKSSDVKSLSLSNIELQFFSSSKTEIRKFCYENSINEDEIEQIHLGKFVEFDKHSIDWLDNIKTITYNKFFNIKINNFLL